MEVESLKQHFDIAAAAKKMFLSVTEMETKAKEDHRLMTSTTTSATGSSSAFCIRWKGFQVNMIHSLEELKNDEDFADVTLACDSNLASVRAHRLVLASCSPYFRRILKEHADGGQSGDPPVIILNEVEPDILDALMTYMYHGQVFLGEDRLPRFFRTAVGLEIKGISDMENSVTKQHQEHPIGDLSLLAAAATQQQMQQQQQQQQQKPPPLMETTSTLLIQNGLAEMIPVPMAAKRRKPPAPRRIEIPPVYANPAANDENSVPPINLSIKRPPTILMPPATAAAPPDLIPSLIPSSKGSPVPPPPQQFIAKAGILTIPNPNNFRNHHHQHQHFGPLPELMQQKPPVDHHLPKAPSPNLAPLDMSAATAAAAVAMKKKAKKRKQQNSGETNSNPTSPNSDKDDSGSGSPDSCSPVNGPAMQNSPPGRKSGTGGGAAGSNTEQMAALLGPAWKSRQPRLCQYCQRMFSNKFNLKQVKQSI